MKEFQEASRQAQALFGANDPTPLSGNWAKKPNWIDKQKKNIWSAIMF